ncbi:hypothetical protein MIND_00699600 [Mycena indigotica]|uniref:DUF7719 domain-containing protein n=1 Tax=Mycena indigotica TaxID=2126181 RepID=A0A8H6W6Q7_9AGAR|nr:uncharacterized protein MIND_00699600 [Mycena indigotica]KAF7301344.1 hypothetical protein MIND_00699600 [Mycena indigotica]
MPKRKTSSSPQANAPAAPLISEEEQWRLINQSGILKKVNLQAPEAEMSLGEEIFNTSLIVIPVCSLLVLMDILTYHQYGQGVNLKTVLDRLIQGIPILSLFIFYSNRHKRDFRMQLLLFILGTASGSRMLYILKRSSYLVNMKQTPPLITLWIYTVVQLDLGFAVSNLLAVAGFCWWKGLDVFGS